MTFSLQTSPIIAVDDAAVQTMMDQQERWLVERKEIAEIADLAKEVASFANTDGGWILIGVQDRGDVSEREPEGATAKLFADPHHWLGQKLRSWLDPVPAFDADTRTRSGRTLAVIRVWRSERAPIVHAGQGVIYERGAAEAIPIRSHERLRDMASRRDEALRHTASRVGAPSTVPAIDPRLGVPTVPNASLVRDLTVILRLTPLQVVDAAFEQVALSATSAAKSVQDARDLLLRFGRRSYGNFSESVARDSHNLKPRPFQRGFATRASVDLNFGPGLVDCQSATYAADAGGVLGVSLRRRVTTTSAGGLDLDATVVATEWLTPSMQLLSDRLTEHYTPGDVRFDLWIAGLNGQRFRWGQDAPGGERGTGEAHGWIQAHTDFSVPASPGRLADAAWRWTRDLARLAGLPVFEYE